MLSSLFFRKQVLNGSSPSANGKESKEVLPVEPMECKEASSIVKKTWNELMKNQYEVGKKIYEFVLTKEISMSVLFMNSQVDKQSALFMNMLNVIIGYLDDENIMDKKLLELGSIHNKRYGVKNEHYKHFRMAFMNAIKTYIPWNTRRESAWLWFWDHVIQVMTIDAQQKEALVSLNLPPEKATEYALAMHDSFDTVLESPVVFGTDLYGALLNEQCELAELFATEFEFQSVRLVAILQHAIRLVDDQTSFQNKVRLLAHQYRGHNIKIEQFELFGRIFIKTLKAINDKNMWMPIYDEAWEWFWQIVVKIYQTESEQH